MSLRARLQRLGRRLDGIPEQAAAPRPVVLGPAPVPARGGVLGRGQLRSALASVAGGLPPARPDQTLSPTDAGVAPGTASGTFRGRLVVVFGTGAGSGLFVYNGTPGLGNPPVASIVAPGVTADPYGNTVGPVLTVGTFGGPGLNVDQFGNLALAGADGSLLELSPEANLPMSMQSLSGVMQTLMTMTTLDVSELQAGVVSGIVLGSGATAKEATLIASPYAATGTGILLQAVNDGGTDSPWITFGTTTTQGGVLTFAPIYAFSPQTFLQYASGGVITVVTKTSGSGTIPIPAGVTVGKGEAWGISGTGGSSGSGGGGGGAGSGGYSAEPALALTSGGTAAYVIPAAGAGADVTLTGSAVTVTAHNGGNATNGTGAGPGASGNGALASGNTVANAGARGGNGGKGGGGGGGSSAGPGGPGNHGNVGSPTAGGAGGAAPGGGAAGGNGGNPGVTGGSGHAPGGAPGGGGTLGGQISFGPGSPTTGQVRLTYSSGAPAVMLSAAAAAGTDQFGTAYLEGLHFTDQVDANTYSLGTVRQTSTSTPTIGSTTAANLAGISIPVGVGTYYYRAVVGINEVAANAAFVCLGNAGATVATLVGLVCYVNNNVIKPQTALANTGLNSGALAAGSTMCVLEGTITVTTAGSLGISLAASANANTFTVISGAFLELKRK